MVIVKLSDISICTPVLWEGKDRIPHLDYYLSIDSDVVERKVGLGAI